MRTLLIAFLLASRCALAQLDDVAFVGSLTTAASSPGTSINPTNLVGYPAISWWKGSDWYTNNGEYWPDRKSGYTLSQTTPTANIITNFLDGQAVVKFTKLENSFMSSSTFTASPPFTVVALMRFRSKNNVGILWDDSGGHYRTDYGSADYRIDYDIAPFNTILANATPSNVWTVVECLYDGGSSAIYTNGVLGDTGGATGAYANGIGIMGFSGFIHQVEGDIAELAAYGTNLATTPRADLYNYFKTNYPSASLP